ncbi:hypothetical protein SDC9_86514 [bioreactor metagenome]|uniref:Uncharacterized protein n=1 Tax=bioreactor metagenome TaxID=1076179 RepID=A0A644ZHT5_9ZZZZ
MSLAFRIQVIVNNFVDSFFLDFIGYRFTQGQHCEPLVVRSLGKMPIKHLAMYPWQKGMAIFTAKHFSRNADMDSFATAHEVFKHGRVKAIISMGTIRDQHPSRNHC